MNSTWDPFAGWSETQMDLIRGYERLLSEANERLNLVSRASVNDLRRLHVEHSLTLALRDFPAGSSVVDWGTGGGLPGIPLAIRFPDVTFHLVDSIRKKSRAVESMVRALGLPNVRVHCLRAEDWNMPVDFAVSRATAPLLALWRWTEPLIEKTLADLPAGWPQGLIVLKGGDLTRELTSLDRSRADVTVEQILLTEKTGRADFTGKSILCVSPNS